jgi:DEAD/DEAH box helicase domain-containing protein
MTDIRDIGSAENLRQQVIGLPTVFLFDRYFGGVGLADRLFEKAHELLQASFQRIQECTCRDGCPSCVGPERFNKEITARFFEKLLRSEIKLVKKNEGT